MGDFVMPSLGADMAAGTLVEWLVTPGQTVKRGDVVAIVETDKGNIDIEIWEPGVVDALRVEPGTKVPVGTVLATVRGEEGRRPEGGGAVRASPAARRLAAERGIDLSTVHGSGEAGIISVKDVEARTAPAAAAAPAAAPAPPAPATDGMRRAIAAAMARSKREIPHYSVSSQIEVSRLLGWLEAENARRPITERLLVAAPILKAVALTLRAFPELNGFYVDDAFQPSDAIHLGFAIATPHAGLVTPAIHDVAGKSVAEVMAALADLIPRARAGGLRSSELADGTFTVTSLGERGCDAVEGIIYPPQVALLGLGRIVERPVAVGGLLGVRPTLTATLSADHRVSDGHRGGLFLRALEERLAHPERL